MSNETLSARTPYVHPDDPAGYLKPGDTLMSSGYDFAWCFVWYKEVPDFPGYCVGSNGTAWTRWVRVYNEGQEGSSVGLGDRWSRLKFSLNNKHYWVCPYRDRKAYQRHIHRLIMETFIGPRPPGLQCCHYDDDPSNNHLRNLRWDTPKANVADCIRNGRKPKGEDHWMSSLTEEQVVEIREVFASGEVSQQQLADRYGVSQICISAAVRGKTWTHVGGPRSYREPNARKLSPSKVVQARSLLALGMSHRLIARQLVMSANTVRLVKLGVYD